jgi:hypothetical protein
VIVMVTKKVYYAHSLPDQTPEAWQPLEDHLQEVADLAGCFSDSFRAKEWGEMAGLMIEVDFYWRDF